MGSDMKSLSKEMIFRVLPEIDKKMILFGIKRIYMKEQCQKKLEVKLSEWLKLKNIKASII